MPGSAVWKSKEAKSRHATGCSISKFSRLEAFDERCRTLPRNSVECAKGHIPPDLVVTPRSFHKTLDISRRYPHDIPSAPTAILPEGDTWNGPPNRYARTARLPSTSTMRRPTLP